MSAKKKSTAKVVIIVVVVVILCLVGGVYLLWKKAQNLASQMNLPTSVEVTTGDISKTVDGSGSLTVADKIEIKVPSELSVSEKLVEAGDSVSRGDILATIDKTSVVSTIVSLQSDLDSVKESLKNASKDKLTSFQIEELQARQANIEARLTLMMIYYENPFVVATEDGIIYTDGSSSSSPDSSSGLLDGIDISSYIPTGADDIKDIAEGDVKAVADDGEGEGEGEGEGDASTIIDISGFSLDAPVTGEAPISAIGSDEYNGAAEWFVGEDSFTGSEFAPETVYKAVITLTPNEGYAFDVNTVPEGYTLESVATDGSGSIVLSIVYPETAAADPDEPSGPDDPVGPDDPSDPSGDTPSSIDDIIDRLIPEGFNLDDYLSSLMAAQAMQNMGGLAGMGGYDLSSLYGAASGIDYGSLADAYSGQIGGSSRSTFSDNTLMTIAKMDNVKITISVDELDILAISEGQKATITLDALEDEVFEGTISRVSPLASQSSGTAKYQVDITIPMHDQMRVGMTASASIVIYEAKDVLVIPLNAIQQRGDQMFVYKGYDDQGNLNDELNVETGISDADYVEITSGLNEGDTIYYIDPEANPLMQYMEAMAEE